MGHSLPACLRGIKSLARLPLIVKPSPGDTIYLYLSVAPQDVSSVLIREEGEKQLPIYYVSKVLNGAEGRYTFIEKMTLALVVTARRLHPYFLSHPIEVKTNIPLKTTIKAQALVDFVSEMAKMSIKDASQDQKWLLHVDGSSTAQGSGAGIVITTPQGEDLEFAIKFDFKASNNEAELTTRATRFIMQEHILYKKSYTHPLLWCLSTEEGIHILQEIHSGCCGTHAGTRILANKALRAGYFWPTMKQDAIRLDNPRGFTGESPFSLVYGTEAIIPAELGLPSLRVMNFSEECNKNLLRENLDLIKELREKTFLRTQRYKNIMINSYNKRVKSRSFQVEDLVLRRADALKPIGKLDLTWEGQYKVTSIIGKGAYELEDPKGRPLPRPWNVHNLKKYYV
ncbi:UNVERIFIED_CONTAM: hypothetical protein Sradi_0705800 [Sesamum radiatum]|uniref:Reverse transcriptase RNase H-like domain-containing protein n=1 Tax=Sesamum radiatum TaxID=300843 RepID=A0AAW2VNC6_SESRA